MGDASVTAAATPDVVDVVLDELDLLWAREPDVGADDRRRFETGLVEVLGNVVEHAHLLDGSELSVDVEVRPDALAAVLGDAGPPVEVDLSAVTMPDADAESGRGLAMALASVDDVRHERVDGRNLWTVRCELRRASTG